MRAAVISKRCGLGHRTKLSIESRGGATGGARLNRRSAPSAAQPTTVNNANDSGRGTSDRVAALSATQQTILQCLYTRHHDGFVRQRSVQQAIGSPHAWVVPFVVQLLGKYVIEIMVAIRDSLSDLDAPASIQQALYGRFLAENPAFLELTSQRVASYWKCYYRSRYPCRTEYPGFRLFPRSRPQRCSKPDGSLLGAGELHYFSRTSLAYARRACCVLGSP